MGPATEAEKQEMQTILQSYPGIDNIYRSLIGSVQYCRLTRLDTIVAAADCSRFLQNPGKTHLKAAWRILDF